MASRGGQVQLQWDSAGRTMSSTTLVPVDLLDTKTAISPPPFKDDQYDGNTLKNTLSYLLDRNNKTFYRRWSVLDRAAGNRHLRRSDVRPSCQSVPLRGRRIVDGRQKRPAGRLSRLEGLSRAI